MVDRKFKKYISIAHVQTLFLVIISYTTERTNCFIVLGIINHLEMILKYTGYICKFYATVDFGVLEPVPYRFLEMTIVVYPRPAKSKDLWRRKVMVSFDTLNLNCL
jgi:hypothetical protein